MKLALGTAQLTSEYGLLKKKLDKKKISKFFEIINNKNFIKLIDTSPYYNKSEKVIGKFLKRKIDLTSKINPFKCKNLNKNIERFKIQIDTTLNNLKTDKLYGLMFHDQKNINLKNEKFFKLLDNLVKNKVVKKIGFSSYNISSIPKIMKIYDFKLVQVPINIFNLYDQNLSNLKKYKKNFNIEIHARSIFLQGLALQNKINSKKFHLLNKKLLILKEYENKYKMTRYEILLSAIFNLGFVDKCVIGCSSLEELNMLKNFRAQDTKKINFKEIIIKNKFILDPRKW